jgi:hypothetical protein
MSDRVCPGNILTLYSWRLVRKCTIRVQSNENVTKGISFHHLRMSPEGKASSFRAVGAYIGWLGSSVAKTSSL